jgi:hypothetical protein
MHGMMGQGMMGYGGYGGMMGPGMMGHHNMMHGMMGPGMMGYGGYGMMNPGMMGYGKGPGTMGGYNYEANQKFLSDTADLRKELHNKKFEYFEAARNPDTKPDTVKNLEKEIWDLQKKISDKWQR